MAEQFPGLYEQGPSFLGEEFDQDVYSTFNAEDTSIDFDMMMQQPPASYSQLGIFVPHQVGNAGSPMREQPPSLHVNTNQLAPSSPLLVYDSGSATSTYPPSFLHTPHEPGNVGIMPPGIYVNGSPFLAPLGGPSPASYPCQVKSPSPLLLNCDGTQTDDNEADDDDEDEAIELSLPHVEEWKRVREHAIIVTGVNTWVPQKVYQPFTEADRKRYIQECQLKETILFVSSAPSEWGVGLEDALKVRLKDLRDKDDPMFEGCGPSVSIRIEWPGYRSWTKQIPTNDFKTPKGPITRGKLAKNIANCVRRFIEWAEKQPMEADSDRRWRVGRKHIKLEDLILVSLHHVSKGSWQPQLRLRRALPELAMHRQRDGT